MQSNFPSLGALVSCALISCSFFAGTSNAQLLPDSAKRSEFHPGYYAFIPSHEPIPREVLISRDFAGLKIKYNWRDLEVAEGVYDFSEIEADLAQIAEYDKQLFIHISYVEWSGNRSPKIPEYMWEDPSYGGSPPYYGAFERTVQNGGWYPLFWNDNVRRQLKGLYRALGERFGSEPNIEGLMMPETAAQHRGNGFDCDGYLQTLKEAALDAKASFGQKSVMQQINFGCFDVPEYGAWLVDQEIGIGAPDINVKETLPTTTYPLFPQFNANVPVGPDVQWDNYVKNDLSVREIRDYVISNLDPWYMFWRAREPFFSDEVLQAVFSRKLPAAEAYYDTVSTATTPRAPEFR